MKGYSVMFVDMVGSTTLKHQYKPQAIFDLTMWLFRMIQAKTGHDIKFTGDGAMVIFPEHDSGSQKALLAAEEIIQEVDGLNLTFKRLNELNANATSSSDDDSPRAGSDIRLQVRIGIASGEASEIKKRPLDVIGSVADLAARLQGEADPDRILVDENTATNVRQTKIKRDRFEVCSRRLMLKGVPEGTAPFYFFVPERLVKKPAEGPYVGGIVALFTHRKSLIENFPAGRLIDLATNESELLIAGRTLKFWATKVLNEDRFLEMAGKKKLRLRFLVSSKAACRYLDAEQRKAIRLDLPDALNVFRHLRKKAKRQYGFQFDVRVTNHLFLDGLVCAEIFLPGDSQRQQTPKRIALQDVNAIDSDAKRQVEDGPNEDDPKATLLLACICNHDPLRKKYCKACGLHDRTWEIYDKHAKDLK